MKATAATRMLILQLAIAGAACAAQGEPASLEPPASQAAQAVSQATPSVPQNTLAAAQPMPSALHTAPAVVSPSAVCDVIPLEKAQLDETIRADLGSDDSGILSVEDATGSEVIYTAPIRFVTYGDINSDDDIPCGMLPDVRIAVIQDSYTPILDWWTAVGGNELGIERFPPSTGVRVPSTADNLSDAPAQFVTTGPDGTAEILLASYDERFHYMFCAISPIDDLIAGCNHISNWSGPEDGSDISTVYIYFTHGHAIVEVWSSDRYQGFLDGTGTAGVPASITFTSTIDWREERTLSKPNTDIAIVGDAHVNAWWTANSNNGNTPLELTKIFVDRSEIFAKRWVHVVTTGLDGIAEASLTPGDYLTCVLVGDNIGCIYEYFGGGHHVVKVHHTSRRSVPFIRKLAEDEGVNHLKAMAELVQRNAESFQQTD